MTTEALLWGHLQFCGLQKEVTWFVTQMVVHNGLNGLTPEKAMGGRTCVEEAMGQSDKPFNYSLSPV